MAQRFTRCHLALGSVRQQSAMRQRRARRVSRLPMCTQAQTRPRNRDGRLERWRLIDGSSQRCEWLRGGLPPQTGSCFAANDGSGDFRPQYGSRARLRDLTDDRLAGATDRAWWLHRDRTAAACSSAQCATGPWTRGTRHARADVRGIAQGALDN
jgi:hypothetical protein